MHTSLFSLVIRTSFFYLFLIHIHRLPSITQLSISSYCIQICFFLLRIDLFLFIIHRSISCCIQNYFFYYTPAISSHYTPVHIFLFITHHFILSYYTPVYSFSLHTSLFLTTIIYFSISPCYTHVTNFFFYFSY